ncbi:MAG: restriction endonuclease subunit S [Staphylococcus equorum]
MTNGVKKVPELRFPGFSGEWETKELGDRVKFYSGLTYTPNDVSKNGTLVLRSSNIFNNHIINADNVYVNSDKATSTYVEYGDVVVVVRNGSRNLIGKHAVIKNEESNAVIGAFMTGIRYEFGSFINALLSTQNFQKEIHKNLGATINQITTGIFKKMTFYFPKKQEEQKIGEFFSKLDRQIELEEQKLSLLEEQKKGYMQQIFSQQLRFKDENRNNYPEWEEKNLKELIDVRDGTHESPKPSKDGYLLVTSKNLKNSKLDLSESYFISKEDYESINQRSKVEIGDILFGMIGTIGNPILLEECDFAIKNVALLKTNDLLEKYYILNFLKSSNISKQFYRMNAGGTQKFIALSTIRDLNIDMPSSEEAIKIGNFFNKVDNLIENQSNKLELLKKRKKSFLQKMFV